MPIQMLSQQTPPQSPMPRLLRPVVTALHDGRPQIRLMDIVENMGLRIPESESPIKSRLHRREECTHVVSGWKQWDQRVWITRS